MPQFFPNFADTISQGFATGQKMAGTNPLGDFIKMMLANRQEIMTQQRDIAGKVLVEQAKAGIEQASPLYKAQTKAYEALGTQRTTTSATNTIEEAIKNEAWTKYQSGDRNPEILKVLGMYTSPPSEMEQFFSGLNKGTNINPIKTSVGRIQVKKKSDGQVGSILEKDFDPTKYEKV